MENIRTLSFRLYKSTAVRSCHPNTKKRMINPPRAKKVRKIFYPKQQFKRHLSLAIKLPTRILTNNLRVLPNFLIIGASKCGTTSLYYYLIQHPSVVPALTKEAHFFDQTYRMGLAWYRGFSSTKLAKYYSTKITKKGVITGEATPCYIFHPHAPSRVFKTVPDAKLIVLLRNPVDRAYSYYHHNLRRGLESLSFEEAIESEEERLRGELEKMIDDNNYFSFNRQFYSYLSRGFYVDQLENWMKFFPSEQILILKSEDLFTDPGSIFKRIVAFLDLPDFEPNALKKANTTPSPEMDAATRKRLVDYFRPYNQKLYDFLGVDFGWEKC
jgi:hypothetical protein